MSRVYTPETIDEAPAQAHPVLEGIQKARGGQPR